MFYISYIITLLPLLGVISGAADDGVKIQLKGTDKCLTARMDSPAPNIPGHGISTTNCSSEDANFWDVLSDSPRILLRTTEPYWALDAGAGKGIDRPVSVTSFNGNDGQDWFLDAIGRISIGGNVVSKKGKLCISVDTYPTSEFHVKTNPCFTGSTEDPNVEYSQLRQLA
ncbi:uncharacterized protein IL334_002720 [Kwoniella shivajii]|uniref:Ricin B lectin domain-containing protein n=1 Tax=Kwoniella shivajii TaxID=564305 RepID=A0ABZ1CVI1_9TREE|nr:hypothetical protein IL334_002720 [Kwoniella shivajii]